MNTSSNQVALDEISIVDFLQRLGHYPTGQSGKEHFYHSMIRETPKNTPSLTVWDTGGKWLDFGGTGIAGISGGGIYQLARAYWPGKDRKELIAKIAETMNIQIAPEARDLIKEIKEKEHEGYAFSLHETKPIGTQPVLTEYLKQRGIYQAAHKNLTEVYYWNRNTPDQKRPYYALGWKNEHDNWEFTTKKGFKSSIGQKGVSVIPGDNKRAVLFEGYIDYLSWLTLTEPQNNPTVIVLNSVVMLQRAMAHVKHIPNIDIYFDNDAAGRSATKMLQQVAPHAVDRSHLYEKFKDYNDYLQEDLKTIQRTDPDISNDSELTR